MLANSPQTRLDITQTQQIARNCGLSLQTACKREVWGTASGGPYHWGGGWGGGYGTGDRDHIPWQTGWWFQPTPLKKYESQCGLLFPIYGIKKMFQTTNQHQELRLIDM